MTVGHYEINLTDFKLSETAIRVHAFLYHLNYIVFIEGLVAMLQNQLVYMLGYFHVQCSHFCLTRVWLVIAFHVTSSSTSSTSSGSDTLSGLSTSVSSIYSLVGLTLRLIQNVVIVIL